MNNIRNAVEALFQSPIQNRSFVSYFAYLSESGKLSGMSRASLNMMVVLCSMVEESERRDEQYKANFKEIESILSKLVEKKTETKEYTAVTATPTAVTVTTTPALYKCPDCDKVLSTKLALSGHMRSHKTVNK